MIYQSGYIMNFHPDFAKKVLFIVAFLFSFTALEGQQTPFNPVSYRVFSPYIFNPAIIGSKDFSSIDFVAVLQGESQSQVLSGNARLLKPGPDYITSPKFKEFSNIGIGGSLFHDVNGSSKSIGVSASASYQIPLNRKKLSFLSFGASVKGVYNKMDSVAFADPDIIYPPQTIYYPDVDLGVYYFGPNIFAGFSTTNLLGNPEEPDTLGRFRMPVSRQFYFIAGYKIVLSRSLNIMLEPSLIINTGDTLPRKITDLFEPALKLYMDDFCIGTYLYDFSNISLFFQYKFPGFYLGTFVDFPRATPFYKEDLVIEFTMGINFSGIKPRLHEFWHW